MQVVFTLNFLTMRLHLAFIHTWRICKLSFTPNFLTMRLHLAFIDTCISCITCKLFLPWTCSRSFYAGHRRRICFRALGIWGWSRNRWENPRFWVSRCCWGSVSASTGTGCARLRVRGKAGAVEGAAPRRSSPKAQGSTHCMRNNVNYETMKQQWRQRQQRDNHAADYSKKYRSDPYKIGNLIFRTFVLLKHVYSNSNQALVIHLGPFWLIAFMRIAYCVAGCSLASVYSRLRPL